MLTVILCIVLVVLITVLIFHPRGPKTTISSDEMRQITRGPKGRVRR